MAYQTAEKLLKMSEVPSECAWYKRSRVCSDDALISKMKQFLSTHVTRPALDVRSASKEAVVDELKKKLDCKTESCVLVNDAFKSFAGESLVDRNLDQNFKPEGPFSDASEWLSNTDIDNTIKQFEQLFKSENFMHVPFQMRDFTTKQTALAKMDVSSVYSSGTRTIGVVFNTDVSTGSGIHWLALFIDMRSKPFTIEYFNSSGDPPLPEIHVWALSEKHKITKNTGVDTDFVNVATFRHQNDNSSCGPYAIYYIYLRLHGIPYQYFRKYRIPDELMHYFRQHLFRTYL